MPVLFPCPYLGHPVEWTEERQRHVTESHPDLLPAHRKRIAETFFDPDMVRCSARSGKARLFSRWYTERSGGKHVVVVVMTDPEAARHWIITAYLLEELGKEAGRRSSRMEAKLTFQYDREGDILHISKCPPYAAQESEEIGDEVIARLNPKTREVENLEVLFFSARLMRNDPLEIPVIAELHLPAKRR